MLVGLVGGPFDGDLSTSVLKWIFHHFRYLLE